MGSPYTSKSSSGYNASPPSDDSSATEANKIKWSTIKTKLPDVLKTFIEAINTALVEHFDRGPISKATDFTTTAAENDQTIEVSGTTTITLGAAASMGAGYVVTIKNLDSSLTTTIARSGSDTIDGATSLSMPDQYDSYVFQVNLAADGYHVLSRIGGSVALAAEATTVTDGSINQGSIDWANAGGLSQFATDVNRTTTTTGAFAGITNAVYKIYVPSNATTFDYYITGYATAGESTYARLNTPTANGTTVTNSNTAISLNSGTVDVSADSGWITLTLQAYISGGANGTVAGFSGRFI